jgi:hypothetical protein
MEKVKWVHVDRLEVVKDGYGGLDQGNEGRRMNRGRLALAMSSTTKFTCEDESVDSVYRSQDSDWPSHGEGASTWGSDSWGWAGHASRSRATPSGFGSLGLKTVGDRFAEFGPQNPERNSAQGGARAIIKSLHWGKVFSWRDRGRPMQGTQLGPFCTLWLSGSWKISRDILEMCNSRINKNRGCPR